MSNPARRTRRLIGLTFLAVAVLLLIAGQTFLHENLRGMRFAFYWLTCLLFVALAMLVALLDLLILRRETRRQQLQLLQQALDAPGSAPASGGNPALNQPGKNHSLANRRSNH